MLDISVNGYIDLEGCELVRMPIVAAWTLDERSIGNTKFVDAELTDDQMKLITREKQHSSMLTAH